MKVEVPPTYADELRELARRMRDGEYESPDSVQERLGEVQVVLDGTTAVVTEMEAEQDQWHRARVLHRLLWVLVGS